MERVMAGVLPLVSLPIVMLALAPWLPRWALMWGMACAIYAGCKWLTYDQARTRGVRTGALRAVGYLFAWPGMDAPAFLRATDRVVERRRFEWLVAGLNILIGAALIWVVARTAYPDHPLVTGWLGMVGMILVLHFGTFHLLSIGWRSFGVNAMPVMRSPLFASSLADFWGRRWNTAFHELATRFTFRPLRPVVGVTGATLLVFLVSGLIHELVISVPARGGYGLPTGYFLIQGAAVAGERTQLAQHLGLGHGWRGWLFTAVVVAGPAFWLFPPPFVHNVVLPLLAVIRAT
jgi:membrane bound O-acyltransferase family protein